VTGTARVRRLRIADPANPYGGTRCTLALDPVTGRVLLYLAGAAATAHAECDRADVLAVFTGAVPRGGGSGCSVERRDGGFAVSCGGATVVIDAGQRERIVAFLTE
jgi:hypothetical protein